MHNNIIYLTNAENQKNHCIRKVYNLIALIADTFATLSIGVCTIFCMYLVYTML